MMTLLVTVRGAHESGGGGLHREAGVEVGAVVLAPAGVHHRRGGIRVEVEVVVQKPSREKKSHSN